jgi:hypothetical protein
MSKDKKVLTGAEAFEAVRLRAEALAEEDVVISGTAYDNAGSRGLGLRVAIAETPGVEDRLLQLPAPLWRRQALDDIEPLSHALLYCTQQVATSAAMTADVLVPAHVVAAAMEVRTRADKLLEYHFSDHPAIARELGEIRLGIGYLDLAQDLTRYAALMEDNKPTIEGDKKYYRKTDVADARKYATEIRTYYNAPTQKPWPDRMRRVFTLLEDAVDEVRAAGQFVFRNEPALAALFISLRPGRTGRRNASRSEASPPATPTTPGATPAAPAAKPVGTPDASGTPDGKPKS